MHTPAQQNRGIAQTDGHPKPSLSSLISRLGERPQTVATSDSVADDWQNEIEAWEALTEDDAERSFNLIRAEAQAEAEQEDAGTSGSIVITLSTWGQSICDGLTMRCDGDVTEHEIEPATQDSGSPSVVRAPRSPWSGDSLSDWDLQEEFPEESDSERSFNLIRETALNEAREEDRDCERSWWNSVSRWMQLGDEAEEVAEAAEWESEIERWSAAEQKPAPSPFRPRLYDDDLESDWLENAPDPEASFNLIREEAVAEARREDEAKGALRRFLGWASSAAVW